MSSEVSPRGKTNTAHSKENVILGQLSSAVLNLYLYQLTFISVDASAVSRNRQIWSNLMSKFRHFENQYTLNLLVFQLPCMLLACRCL